MKQALLILYTLIFIQFANSQQPNFQQKQGERNMNMGHFYGRIVDTKTNKPVEAATVQLTGNKFDTASKQMNQAILATVLTESNGDFSLENIPVFGNFNLIISAVGYEPVTEQVSFGVNFKQQNENSNNGQNGMQQMLSMIDKDLGNIKLQPSTNTLSGVTVTATTKPFFEMGVDRKIFNVDKNLVSQGQTATEVMKQIPGLNVDIDGNVTMRNAAPQLFVDGRPTTLTLDQIPADVIDRVELITNPSSKFDASGGNAGILNVVLKKNIKKGYNGGIRAGIDSRGKINAGGDFNFRQNKLNFFLSGNYRQNKSKSEFNSVRNNFLDTPGTVMQNGNGTNVGNFAFVRGGFDYFIDNRNTITLTGSYVQGKFTNDQSQRIDSLTNDKSFISYSNLNSHSESNFKNRGGQLSFKHNFTKDGHNLTADINYNDSKNDNYTLLNTSTFLQNNSSKFPPFLQQTNGSGSNRFLTIQSDYENPITDNKKIEAGVRAAIRDFKNESIQSFFSDSLNQYIIIPTISNNYQFKDHVYAAYTTYTFKTKKWNYQLGLRAESSNYNGSLLGKDSLFKINFPVSIFPSAFITYHLSEKQDLQMNYSRRINRPSFFQLLPFVDISDPQNLSIGNPNLKPEFTNSFELSYNKSYSKNSNFLASAYFKYSTNLITRFQYLDKNPVSPTDTAVFNTYANADHSTSYGLELTNRTTVAKIWDVTLNVNLYNSTIDASNLQTNLTNSRISGFAKWNNTIKLSAKFTIQFSGNYQAKTVLPPSNGSSSFGGGGGGRGGGSGFFGFQNTGTAQGYIFPNYSFDAAIKKDWNWKGGNTASLTLSMNDIFATARNKTFSESPYFTQMSERRRDPQVLRLNFSYRFGKFDVSLFKRKNMKTDENGTEMMPQ